MKFPFRKKKKPKPEKEEAIPEEIRIGPPERGLPPELEKLKVKGPFEEKVPEELGKPLVPPIAPPPRMAPERPPERAAPPARIEEDKLELILSKLDTIDARLRVIEEKLKRF